MCRLSKAWWLASEGNKSFALLSKILSNRLSGRSIVTKKMNSKHLEQGNEPRNSCHTRFFARLRGGRHWFGDNSLAWNHPNLQQVPDDLTDEDIQISASEEVEQASYDFETQLLPGEPTQNALSLMGKQSSCLISNSYNCRRSSILSLQLENRERTIQCHVRLISIPLSMAILSILI